MNNQTTLSGLSLFSGAGGMDVGFLQAGINNAAPPRLRRLTVDEALRLQTFPHCYEFIGSQSSIYRQIGNAVPCHLAQVVAEVIRDCLIQGKVEAQIPIDSLNSPRQNRANPNPIFVDYQALAFSEKIRL
ncbi:DNA cytosine methyltransferase [Oscillatoria amoena NRMC-F 0135]|nr:DNA cytosine methyltransferase [Desertifilum sp.]MDI9635822.1 DNA cytosine methyltransferase [Geitlerinema splendidum]MDL5047416.1 DNA cytosine methyltransferase [Oscillatoria amoena NRMC-F 0135]